MPREGLAIAAGYFGVISGSVPGAAISEMASVTPNIEMIVH
jgi:hypothetical protein